MSGARKNDEGLPVYQFKEVGEETAVYVLDAQPEDVAGHRLPRRFQATVQDGRIRVGPFEVKAGDGVIRAVDPRIQERFKRQVCIAGAAIADPGPQSFAEREALVRDLGRDAPDLRRVAEVCENARRSGFNEALEVGREFGYAQTASYGLIQKAREAFPERFTSEDELLRDVARIYTDNPRTPRKALLRELPRQYGYLNESKVDRLIKQAKCRTDPLTGSPFLI